MADIKPKPIIAKRPDESVIVRIHYKRRGGKGRLEERKFKSLTVHNFYLDEVSQRIRTALSRS
jgi:hypothetical protein